MSDGFAEVFKNLAIATDLKIILLEIIETKIDRNNYVRRLSWLLECQNFLRHYVSVSYIKLFSDLCPKFLDT